MSGDVFASIREDIQIIHNRIKNQLTIKAGHVGEYAHVEFSPMDNFIRPAVVLTAAGLYNCKSSKVISLGAIVQFIFMASQIHKQIPETAVQARQSDPRDGTQFPVLVGDYLYGKFFTTLCEADLLQYLRPLAEIISRIHEGGILQRKNLYRTEDNHQLVSDIIRLEVAELMGGAARLAGDLAGAPEEDQKYLYEFGINLGMFLGFLQRNPLHIPSMRYIDQALGAIEKLPNHPEKAMLNHLVNALVLTEEGIRQVV